MEFPIHIKNHSSQEGDLAIRRFYNNQLSAGYNSINPHSDRVYVAQILLPGGKISPHTLLIFDILKRDLISIQEAALYSTSDFERIRKENYPVIVKDLETKLQSLEIGDCIIGFTMDLHSAAIATEMLFFIIIKEFGTMERYEQVMYGYIKPALPRL